jgi:hypothetical protein
MHANAFSHWIAGGLEVMKFGNAPVRYPGEERYGHLSSARVEVIAQALFEHLKEKLSGK